MHNNNNLPVFSRLRRHQFVQKQMDNNILYNIVIKTINYFWSKLFVFEIKSLLSAKYSHLSIDHISYCSVCNIGNVAITI